MRFGGILTYSKFKIKCKGKDVDADTFIEDWHFIISVKKDGRGDVIVVEDTNAAITILQLNGKSLWHHGQKSRRYPRK
jgi:hypothetical protein